MTESDIPVRVPLLTDALVAQIHRTNEEQGIKEFAFDTLFRHSDAGRCARAMGYQYIQKFATPEDFDETPATEPMDIAGEWVTWLGSLIHEKLQEALHDRFGSAVDVEVKVRHGSLSSGHIDAVIEHVEGIGRIAYELKTKGSYGFNKAVGIDRKAYKEIMPEGPGSGAKIQGALNAAAVDADLLVIGVIGLEAVSKQLRSRVGWNDLQAFIAEWHYPKAEFGPWAADELERMSHIGRDLEAGCLSPRFAIGDQHQQIELDPSSARPDWRCSYCQFNTRCRWDGPGIVALGDRRG